jgi:hypothetical protein
MRLMRNPWTRAFLVWAAVCLAVALLLGMDAFAGLIRAQDACFYQGAPCPQAGHPKLIQLEVAFLGIPLVWGLGVVLGVVARAVAARRPHRR